MSLPDLIRVEGIVFPAAANGVYYTSAMRYYKYGDSNYELVWDSYETRWILNNRGVVVIHSNGYGSSGTFPFDTHVWVVPDGGETILGSLALTAINAVEVQDIYGLQGIQILGLMAAAYVQVGHIDASATDPSSPSYDSSVWQSTGFGPIGTQLVPFAGTYDGGGYEIRHLFINRPTTNYVGLFGQVENTQGVCGLWNVRLSGAVVTGKDYVGALVGQNRNTTKDCYVKNVVVSGIERVGGVGLLQAKMHHPEDVCHNVILENATINGRALVGLFSSQINMHAEDCHAIGTNIANVVTHNNLRNIGGFGATVNTGIFKRCSVVGTINIAPPTGAAETNLGGFTGRSNAGNYEDCFSRVTVNLESGSWPALTFVSDFTGKPTVAASTWRRCYAAGNQDAFFGGDLVAESVVENCFFEGTDDKNDRGAIGRTPAKMKEAAFYPGWNFRTLWKFDPAQNNGYPYLDPRKAPQSAFPGLYRSLYQKR